MPEVLCQFKFSNSDEEKFFLTEPNVTLRQFRNFLQKNFAVDSSPLNLYLNDAPLISDEQLKAAFDKEAVSLVAQIPKPEPVEEPKPETPSQVKLILERFAIAIPEHYNQVDLIRLLPFPVLQDGKFDELALDEAKTEAIANNLASILGVNTEALVAEIIAAASVIRAEKEKADEEKIEAERLAALSSQESSEPELFGPTLRKLMARFHVDPSALNTSSLNDLLKSLPPFYARFFTGKCPSRYPDRVRRLSYKIAKRFNLPVEEVVAEVNHVLNTLPVVDQSGEQALRCPRFNRGNSNEAQQKKEIVRHEAYCDKCNADIEGIRYKCLSCPDYDLCASCEELNARDSFHDGHHVFAKLYNRQDYYKVHRIMNANVVPQPGFGCGRGRPFIVGGRRDNSFRQERRQRIETLEETVKTLQDQMAKLLEEQ